MFPVSLIKVESSRTIAVMETAAVKRVVLPVRLTAEAVLPQKAVLLEAEREDIEVAALNLKKR